MDSLPHNIALGMNNYFIFGKTFKDIKENIKLQLDIEVKELVIRVDDIEVIVFSVI